MRSSGKFALITLLAIIVGGAAVGTLIVARGISASDEPLALEAFVARQLRHLSIPWAKRAAPNPVAQTKDVLVSARAHFADHCAVCHANDGGGKTSIGENLYPKAPDMRKRDTQSLSDGELFYIIRNGVRWTGMPAWGDGPAEEDEESWGLVQFIRQLPNLTDEDLREMRTLNPKSPHEIREEEESRRFLDGESEAPDAPAHQHGH